MTKDYGIRVLIQPSGSNDYWIRRLVEGIRNEARNLRKPVDAVYFSPREPAESLAFGQKPVLLAGTTGKWFSDSAAFVRSCGGYPVFVNACVPGFSRDSSGVYFALENAVRDCVAYMAQLGRKHPVLVGLNPSSDADRRKAEVFRAEGASGKRVQPCSCSLSTSSCLAGQLP